MRQRIYPDISPERLQSLYGYNDEQGVIFRKENNRIILPEPETGMVSLYDNSTKSRKNLLYYNLAFILGSGKVVPSDKKVLCLDLNPQNIKLRNLKLVDRTVYKEIQRALRNLAGALNIRQHPQDKHAYLVTWLEKSQHRLVFYDISSADQFKQKKSLELVKFVNQHIPTN